MNNNLIINSNGREITSGDRVFYSNGWRVNNIDPEGNTFKIYKDKIEIKLRSKKD